jgi:hypothetical protein
MQASMMIKLQIGHVEIRAQVSEYILEHSNPLTISDLSHMNFFFKYMKYIFALKTSKLENFVVSSKNVITDIHL